MGYEKMPAIKGGVGGCLCCGYQHEHLALDTEIAVGFGMAFVTLNDEIIYDEMTAEKECKPYWKAQDAENEALKNPENDWRIHLIAPMSERHYQRQGEGLWVLYEKGLGFA